MTVEVHGGKLTASGTNATGVAVDSVNMLLDDVMIDATTPLNIAAGTTVQVNSCMFNPTAIVNAGALEYLFGDRAVWDVANRPDRHASDISGSIWVYHRNPALSGSYTVNHPSVRRILDVTSVSLNEMAALVGTILQDLGLA